MRRLSILAVMLLLPALAGCRGRSDEPAGSGQGESSVRAVEAATAEQLVLVCPECAGLGRSPHSGDERPCYLCTGDGRCGICSGEGRHRDGICTSCDGGGECSDCSGDGVISSSPHDAGSLLALIPGECPVCLRAYGMCPECGGAGDMPSGRQCAFCDGERWCPECRGSGEHRLCAGRGICPLCRGSGALLDGDPAPGDPTLAVHLRDGGQVVATLLAAPDRMLTIERQDGAQIEREAISLTAIESNDVLLAFRLFSDDGDPGLRLASASYCLSAGPRFHSAARHDALAAREAGASDAQVDLILAAVDGPRAKWLEDEAQAAISDDPRRAWILLNTRLKAFPGGESAARLAGLSEQAAARVAAVDSDLPPELLERRAAALEGRLARVGRRAGEWRVRAEELLARTGASEDTFLRAHRGALESWLLSTRGANRTEAALAEDLLECSRRARQLRVRAIIGLASRLLDKGHVERARALGVIALSLSRDDSGAAQFLAAVESALGHRAGEEDDR